MRAPQAFLSSSLTELSFVREPVGEFLRSSGWNVVEFERGDITWSAGQDIDENCAAAVKDSDVLVLLLGKFYGRSEVDFDRYKDSLSITEHEYYVARDAGKFVYCFVQSAVDSDYRTWEMNGFSDDVTFGTESEVLSFLRTIRSDRTEIPIQTFERSSEITSYLKSSWASLLRAHFSGFARSTVEDRLGPRLERIERVLARFERNLENIFLQFGEPGAKPNIQQLQKDRKSEDREALMKEIERTNFWRFLQRHVAGFDRDTVINRMQENEKLEGFLAALEVNENEIAYVADHKGSHSTYEQLRQLADRIRVF